MREQRLELASGELARRIFATEDPESRASLTENLHRQLDEIFELKQENRRDEIAELELQLQELREQLAAREANREAIIGRRLEALLANPHR
jgi:polyhydroxyalkanoate synthesis regulator phasin